MRIIAGSHRGRRLRGPSGVVLRPTSDRVREALFSILGDRLPSCRFLDLYAGTGAVGIEAVSRGAAMVTCVESDTHALRLLRKNVSDCGMDKTLRVQAQSVTQFLARPDRWHGPYNIVFADPPYADTLDLISFFEDAATDRLFADDARLIVEHGAKTELPPRLGRCLFLRRYDYGDTALSTFSFAGPARS